MLDPSQQQELLRVARTTLDERLGGGHVSAPKAGPPIPGAGVFVSLHKRSGAGRELRGCMGIWDDRTPLQQTVARTAIAAATRDPRFSPVTLDELEDIEIEISVLAPMERLPSADDLRLGTHGIQVSRGDKRGLLLPQVAGEHGWDREEFLCQTCMKAGLDRQAWRDSGTRIDVFCAEVFRDS